MILWGHFIFLGTLFLNSCLHGLWKLNCYNHVFLSYFQVLELDLNFVVVLKIKFKYLKACEIFLQVFELFLKHLNIDVVNIFWLMEFVSQLKSSPTPKNDIIFRDIFGVLFQIQMIWHKLIWKAKRMLEMLMKKTKSFFCFEMLKEG